MRLCINKKCSLCPPLFGNFSIAKCCSVVNCFFIILYCFLLFGIGFVWIMYLFCTNSAFFEEKWINNKFQQDFLLRKNARLIFLAFLFSIQSLHLFCWPTHYPGDTKSPDTAFPHPLTNSNSRSSWLSPFCLKYLPFWFPPEYRQCLLDRKSVV